MTLFVDTNFFLQLKDPSSLPWAEISDTGDVVVVIPRTVQSEIDRLKSDGNGRRARRARNASSFFRTILNVECMRLEIKKSHPRVTFTFPPLSPAGTMYPTSLNPNLADDRLISEILDYSASRPEEEVALLTNDTGPMLTAKQHGIKYVEVPESWVLSPEPDDRDKTIGDLKRRLEILENSNPKIVISAWAFGGEVKDMALERQTFQPLPNALLDEIVAEITRRSPIIKTTGALGAEFSFHQTQAIATGRRFRPPTEDEIKQYRENDYPNWVDEVRAFMVSLPERLNHRSAVSLLEFHVQNEGTVPAMNVAVGIKAQGGVRIQATSEKRQQDTLRLPVPPNPPQGRYSKSPSSFLTDLASLREPVMPLVRSIPEHDRNDFYWKGRRDSPCDLLALTCTEFRHQAGKETFRVEVVVLSEAKTGGAVTFGISASNLPIPATLTIPVKIKDVDGDTEAIARNLVAELPDRSRALVKADFFLR